jgi:hypothetical protein
MLQPTDEDILIEDAIALSEDMEALNITSLNVKLLTGKVIEVIIHPHAPTVH